MTDREITKNNLRGIILIIMGVVLLLYTLGFMQKGLNTLLIIGSICLIIYGAVSSGIYQMLRDMFKKNK